MKFHDNNVNKYCPTIFSQEKIFGILNIHLKETEINKRPIFIFFTNDISGSMSDYCSDERTKMSHSIHAIRNILMLFDSISDKIDIWVQVDAFDDNIEKIIPLQKMNHSNLNDMLSSLKKMRPRNGTNIELALKNSLKEIQSFKEKYPDYLIKHIFTTDGNSTSGSREIFTLSSLLDQEIGNIFIGFGLDHSVLTLNGLANSYSKGEYFFIDDIENGGLVYGEIIHSILYPCIEDIEIKITNGFIYDFKKNIWTDILYIDSLFSESNKTFHLYSIDPSLIEVSLIGKKTIDKTIMGIGAKGYEITNLNDYIFRQKVQELLFLCKDSFMKTEIEELLNNLKQYMLEMDLKDNGLLNSLHDDLWIVLNTDGTKISKLFLTARSNSNGKQLSYNIHKLPNQITGFHFNKLLSREPVNRDNSTPKQLEIMRSCSQPMDDEDF
jgi:tmRNA-binding protein